MDCKNQGLRMDPANYFCSIGYGNGDCNIPEAFCNGKSYSGELVYTGMVPVEDETSSFFNPVHDRLVRRCFYQAGHPPSNALCHSRFCYNNGPGTVARQYLSLIHISEPTRRTPISYAVFCLKKK